MQEKSNIDSSWLQYQMDRNAYFDPALSPNLFEGYTESGVSDVLRLLEKKVEEDVQFEVEILLIVRNVQFRSYPASMSFDDAVLESSRFCQQVARRDVSKLNVSNAEEFALKPSKVVVVVGCNSQHIENDQYEYQRTDFRWCVSPEVASAGVWLSVEAEACPHINKLGLLGYRLGVWRHNTVEDAIRTFLPADPVACGINICQKIVEKLIDEHKKEVQRIAEQSAKSVLAVPAPVQQEGIWQSFTVNKVNLSNSLQNAWESYPPSTEGLLFFCAALTLSLLSPLLGWLSVFAFWISLLVLVICVCLSHQLVFQLGLRTVKYLTSKKQRDMRDKEAVEGMVQFLEVSNLLTGDMIKQLQQLRLKLEAQSRENCSSDVGNAKFESCNRILRQMQVIQDRCVEVAQQADSLVIINQSENAHELLTSRRFLVLTEPEIDFETVTFKDSLKWSQALTVSEMLNVLNESQQKILQILKDDEVVALEKTQEIAEEISLPDEASG